jgi:hypothetical protein
MPEIIKTAQDLPQAVEVRGRRMVIEEFKQQFAALSKRRECSGEACLGSALAGVQKTPVA